MLFTFFVEKEHSTPVFVPIVTKNPAHLLRGGLP